MKEDCGGGTAGCRCEPRLFRTFTRAPPTCPLLLVALALELHPLFHSPTGHSGYCWEPSWDPNWEPSWACGPDWITVSRELMVSSVEAIPERGSVLTDRQATHQCVLAV